METGDACDGAREGDRGQRKRRYPSAEAFEAMGRFNEGLVNAGVLLAADGLRPSSNGKRIAFDGASRTVIDGPFAETRELVAVSGSGRSRTWTRRSRG